MKKFLSIVLALAMLALCCLPVAADSSCQHTSLHLTGQVTETVVDGCDVYEIVVNTYSCDNSECVYSIADEVSREHIGYSHTPGTYEGESCDGIMHYVYYTCARCNSGYSEANWCSGGDQCPYN
ncbi:MAG: hypothetical protein IJ493_11310 [Clostridia bacterium]|nr:hypothetical protein [Clostridia bacterium]